MIPAVLRSILASEKAVATLLPTLGVTVALLLGKVTFDQWQEFTLIAMGIYVGGKTIQGSAQAMASKKGSSTKADVVVVAEGGKSSS